jgi:hypothetical protein
MNSDITPVSQSANPAPLPTISLEDVRELERKCRENRAAQLRGEPPLHDVTAQNLRDAIIAIRSQRGTMNIANEAAKKANGGKKAAPISINIDDLDDM